MSIFLIRGTEGSSIFNGIIVFLKVSVVLVFVALGWKYINTENYVPYIPANTGTLGEYGFSGVLRGAAIVFFAFLRPRDMPSTYVADGYPPLRGIRPDTGSN